MTAYAYTRHLPNGTVKTVGGFRKREHAAWAAHQSAVDNGYEPHDRDGQRITQRLLTEPFTYECSGVTYTTHAEGQ